MESPCTGLLLLLFANVFLIGASSADFLECLIDKIQQSNSTTDVIYTPQNASYASILLENLFIQKSVSWKKPDLIVTPYHESEIQATIYCSKKLGIQIRVRSGGHDYESLSHTSEIPFVMVDMKNFRSITIDSEEKTAWVQVGATLGQLYYKLARKSRTLAVVGGTCPTVGVGGHFSGGGYGMMSRKHGIAADHIIDAKLINADGKILDRKTMGEDLFWAIRGGGGTSFGIVLEFKVNLVTVPETVTVFNVTRTSEQNAVELVHRWQYIADKVDESLLLRLFLSSVRSRTTGNMTIAASFTSLYLGPVICLLRLMQVQFPELGLVEQDCKEMSWIESVLFFAQLANEPLDILLDKTPLHPVYFKGKSDFVSKQIPANGLTQIWRFLLEEETYHELQFSPYGGAMNKFLESEIPFPHRSGNIFMIEYGVVWFEPYQSEKHMEWIRRLYNYMARHVTKSPRAAYVNYRDLDIGRNREGNTSYSQASVWGRKYFKNNFKRLVRVKTKVDPSNFFRNEQSIPPLFPSRRKSYSWI